MIAAIRIRGTTGIRKEIAETMKRLNLNSKNAMTFLKDSPEVFGMIRKCKDYITWGDLDDETRNLVISKKGEAKAYRLSPPRGGFERKGIKKPFSIGGALGNRKEKINYLIKRMI